jgi:hypothetical protein
VTAKVILMVMGNFFLYSRYWGGGGGRRRGVDDQHPSMIYYTRIFQGERALCKKRKEKNMYILQVICKRVFGGLKVEF